MSFLVPKQLARRVKITLLICLLLSIMINTILSKNCIRPRISRLLLKVESCRLMHSWWVRSFWDKLIIHFILKDWVILKFMIVRLILMISHWCISPTSFNIDHLRCTFIILKSNFFPAFWKSNIIFIFANFWLLIGLKCRFKLRFRCCKSSCFHFIV